MQLRHRLHVIWHAPEHFQELEENMMATAAEYAARLNDVANDLAEELRVVKQRAEDEGNAAWSAALDGPIARLEGMGQSEETPDAPPADPTPAPNEGDPGSEPTA